MRNPFYWFLPGRAANPDPIAEVQLWLRVLRKRQEALMATVQEINQKVSDQKAALDSLSAAVDTMKAGGGKLNPTDQALLDGVGVAMDSNAASIAAIQTKVSNP